MNYFTRPKLFPLLFLLFPLTVIVVLLWVYRSETAVVFSSSEKIQDWVAQWGSAAPAAFIGLQFFQVVVFFIPGEIPQIAGGYLFGFFFGSLYSSTGILLGSAFNFFLARTYGLPLVTKLFGRNKVESFSALLLSRKVMGAFFLLFVIPGIPKDFLCYIAGLSKLTFPAFMGISFLGRLPGVLGSSLIGTAAAEKRWLLAAAVLIVSGALFLGGLLWRNRVSDWIRRQCGLNNARSDRSALPREEA